MLPAEQLRPWIARRREQWKKYQGRLDPARLVFIDETWAEQPKVPAMRSTVGIAAEGKTNMAPLRG